MLLQLAMNRFFRIFFNKYVLSLLAFVVWLTLFDKNNMTNQYKLYRQMLTLEKEKAYYTEEIKKDRQTTTELKTNLRNLEKFARERYLMKKDNEDIFLFLKENTEEK